MLAQKYRLGSVHQMIKQLEPLNYRKKVNRLSQKVKTLESREPAQPASATAVKVKVSDSGSKKPLSQQEDDFFC